MTVFFFVQAAREGFILEEVTNEPKFDTWEKLYCSTDKTQMNDPLVSLFIILVSHNL